MTPNRWSKIRPLLRALDQVNADDVLMVTRLARPARSTHALLNALAIVADRHTGFRSLGDAWADTTTAHGRLMLTILGGLAEFERELTRARMAVTVIGRERLSGWFCLAGFRRQTGRVVEPYAGANHVASRKVEPEQQSPRYPGPPLARFRRSRLQPAAAVRGA
jgi:hypothetical protein